MSIIETRGIDNECNEHGERRNRMQHNKLDLSKRMDGAVRKVLSLFRSETTEAAAEIITDDIFLSAARALKEHSKDGVLPEKWQEIVQDINNRRKS